LISEAAVEEYAPLEPLFLMPASFTSRMDPIAIEEVNNLCGWERARRRRFSNCFPWFLLFFFWRFLGEYS
jgi:hypothetical protein